MKKLKQLCAATLILSAIAAKATSTVDPQPGQSVWEITGKIGTVLDELSPYKPIAISNANVFFDVIMITVPGKYRLSETLNYPVIIATDKVELDLNHYGISVSSVPVNGIEIADGIQKIVIHDGYIEGPANSGCFGVYAQADATTISDIYLENIDVFGFYDGYYFSDNIGTGTIKNFFLNGCSSSNAVLAGIYMLGLTDSVFNKCIMSGNGSRGFGIYSAKYNSFNLCVVNNSGNGFYLSGANNNNLYRCISGTNSDEGFYLVGSSYNNFRKCVSSDNGANGYLLELANYNVFERCIAMHNSFSTALSAGGFKFTNGSVYNLFDQCVASGNNIFGFFCPGAVSNYNFLDECISRQNATNYSLSGPIYTFRCQDIATASAGWNDNAANTGWMARG